MSRLFGRGAASKRATNPRWAWTHRNGGARSRRRPAAATAGAPGLFRIRKIDFCFVRLVGERKLELNFLRDVSLVTGEVWNRDPILSGQERDEIYQSMEKYYA
jgi:hypothetical protein